MITLKNKLKIMNKNHKIVIIGLGYVGLPLAVEFAKKYHVVGFDINTKRINELKSGIDKTLEVENDNLKSVLINDLNSKKDYLLLIILKISLAQIFILLQFLHLLMI